MESNKWIKYGLKEQQEIIDEINKAYEVKEKLDSNIYVGKTKYGNICMCLDGNGQIEKAFPVITTREDYLKIKDNIKSKRLGEPDELHLQVVSLFFAIDLNNYKEVILKAMDKLPQELELDLFNCTITDNLTIINMELGRIVVGTKYVNDFLKGEL